MAAISGFTYTQLTRKKMEDSRVITTQLAAAGNGSLTYPTGGIPIMAGTVGLPYGQVDILNIMDQNGDGYTYTWNRTNNKIQMFVVSGATGNALVELASGQTPTVQLTLEFVGY